MATLYVKTPNGTQYSIDLTKVNSGGGSAATNGYALMNNGCTLQWGKYTGPSGGAYNPEAVSFPIAFASACYAFTVCFSGTLATGYLVFAYIQLESLTKSQFQMGYAHSAYPMYWIAVGK